MWKTAPSALQEGEKVTGEEGIKGCWISEVMKNQFNLAKEIPGSLAVERGIRAAPGPDMTRYEELVIENYNWITPGKEMSLARRRTVGRH